MENNSEAIELGSSSSSAITYDSASAEKMELSGVYTFQCIGPKDEYKDEYLKIFEKAGQLIAHGKISEGNKMLADALWMAEEKWTDTIQNLVTTVGKNNALDNNLSGSAYTAAWFLGLVDGAAAPTFAAADTMASHAGWVENQNYSQATRPAAAWSAAAATSKAFSAPLAFSINAAGQTIAGCFLTTVSTKGGITGILYSCGAFTGGNQAIGTGSTLNVSYTASA
jgi:hypothetical protein